MRLCCQGQEGCREKGRFRAKGRCPGMGGGGHAPSSEGQLPVCRAFGCISERFALSTTNMQILQISCKKKYMQKNFMCLFSFCKPPLFFPFVSWPVMHLHPCSTCPDPTSCPQGSPLSFASVSHLLPPHPDHVRGLSASFASP